VIEDQSFLNVGHFKPRDDIHHQHSETLQPTWAGVMASEGGEASQVLYVDIHYNSPLFAGLEDVTLQLKHLFS